MNKNFYDRMESVIKTENLTKYYGKVKGIENLNLSVRKGEIYGFLGPNGAGKTTSIRLLLHLIIPSSGKIKLFDKNLAKHYKNLFRRIGNVPGEFKLYEEVTGAYFLNYLNAFSREEPKLQTELIEEFRLTDEDLHKKIRQYSRGMKQKLLLIQALQEEPDLLILDEPSAGLDPLNKKVLYDYLQKFKKSGRTVFFSSHNLAEVDKICDRAGIVRDGNLIESKTFDVLLSRPVTRFEILTAQILFLFVAEGLIVVSMFLGTVLGNVHFKLGIVLTDYFRIAAAGYFFYLSMGSIAFAVAAFQDERGKALAKTVGIVIFLYFFDTILKLNKSLNYLLNYSYFQLYRPGELVTGESSLHLSIMISLILIISFLSIANIKFLQRDL